MHTARHIAYLAAIAALFIAVSYVAERHQPLLIGLVEQGGAWSGLAFIVATALFVVFFIPLDIALLIPAGTTAFGPLATALLSIVGWTLGAATAFLAARRFGRPLVERFVGFERVRAVEARIPKHHLFWSVVGLRMLVPVDVLSYALGLGSAMPWERYVLATLIGVSPFGFFFAYTGALPLTLRIGAVILAVAMATFVFLKSVPDKK